jgi:hypothetical protein
MILAPRCAPAIAVDEPLFVCPPAYWRWLPLRPALDEPRPRVTTGNGGGCPPPSFPFLTTCELPACRATRCCRAGKSGCAIPFIVPGPVAWRDANHSPPQLL